LEEREARFLRGVTENVPPTRPSDSVCARNGFAVTGGSNLSESLFKKLLTEYFCQMSLATSA